MTIEKLIANQINHCKNRCYSCNQLGYGKLKISYHLTLPAFADDSDFITSNNCRITYMGNKKKKMSRFTVNNDNVNNGYPRVTSNKRLSVDVVYNIKDWLNFNVNSQEFHIMNFLSIERERVFREFKSNITLIKIGHLSKQWQDESDGKYHIKDKFNYGESKFNTEVNNKYYNVEAVEASF